MESPRKAVKIALLLAVFLFPLFGLLDLAVYPDFIKQLFTIRAVATVYMAFNLAILKKIKDNYLFPSTFFFFLIASFSISLMCYLTGDGFASPYYAGQFVVIIVSTIFFPMKKKYYVTIVTGSMVQHFVFLSFLPWQISDLAKNVFFLGAFIFSGWVIRKYIFRLLSEIKTLQGIIPICANCKKIRNDTGYWDQVENYISEHSEAEFSHSICPDCAKKLYGIFLNKSSD